MPRPRKTPSPDPAPAEQAPRQLQDLAPAPYNPRQITSKAKGGLRRSLVEFWDISGITYNFRTGSLIAGHQRREELALLDPGEIAWEDWRETELGRERFGSVEVKGGARFRVRGVDWSAAKEKAANVAANSPALAGEFTGALQDLLDEIADDADLFSGLRFDELRVEALAPPEDFPDATPEGAADGLEHECPRCGFRF